MPWAKWDDGYWAHPKVQATSLRALGVHGLAVSWSNHFLTDGYIPHTSLPTIRCTKALAEELVRTGLFDRADGGYRVHDFLHYSKAKSVVLSERDRWAESKRESRKSPQDVLLPRTSTRSPVPVPASSLKRNAGLERGGAILPRAIESLR